MTKFACGHAGGDMCKVCYEALEMRAGEQRGELDAAAEVLSRLRASREFRVRMPDDLIRAVDDAAALLTQRARQIYWAAGAPGDRALLS
jgi:hypothetical protein